MARDLTPAVIFLTDPPVSLHFHRHHDVYASILIAPVEDDSMLMRNRFERDNRRRQRVIQRGAQDPGRGEVNWFKVKISFFFSYLNILTLSAIVKNLSGEYQLILIHPLQFLTHGSSVEIKYPVTQELKRFLIPQDNSGFLREGSAEVKLIETSHLIPSS